MEEIPENGNLKLPILKYTGVAYFEKKNFFCFVSYSKQAVLIFFVILIICPVDIICSSFYVVVFLSHNYVTM